MSHQAKPVDTSHIDLSALADLSEYLAEQSHEMRAQQMPDLLAYADLPDSERDYSRKMSEHTLKLIIVKGYQLNPPDGGVPPLTGDGPAAADKNEMEDEQELAWLESRIQKGETHLKPFKDRLEWLANELGPAYRLADGRALYFQKLFRYTSFGCMVFAGLAVLLAIYQLAEFTTFGAPPLLLPFLEFLMVVSAVSLVWLDFRYGWRDSWLAYRSRAERLRALKFRALLDPALWSNVTRAAAEAKIAGMGRAIKSITQDNIGCHLADAELNPPVPDMLTANSSVDHAIGNYYLRRRLTAQSDYTELKGPIFHQNDQSTRILGPTFFFGVLLFVFAHDVVDGVNYLSRKESRVEAPAAVQDKNAAQAVVQEAPSRPADDWPKRAGKWLIFLAAILPAASSALRVHRSGREWGRNHLRTESAFKRLSRLRQELETSNSRKEQIRLMIQSEVTLASEHEQWLQLMKECEWFG
jgi:hypothetical protein